MGCIARHESDAIATSALHKYAELEAGVLRLGGIQSLALNHILVTSEVEEPIKVEPTKVGIGKMEVLQPHIEHALELMSPGQVPPYVTIMDVLPVADLPHLDAVDRVMKKPEAREGSALQVFTEWFASCLDEMKEQGRQELPITYYVLMAQRKVDIERCRLMGKTEVGRDKLIFSLSQPLVRLLADPGSLRQVNESLRIFDVLLSNKTVRACKMQSLVPAVTQIAAMKQNDGLYMNIIYDKGRGWEKRIDSKCDLGSLENNVSAGVGEIAVGLGDFVTMTTHNVTLWLLNQMFVERRQKVRD